MCDEAMTPPELGRLGVWSGLVTPPDDGRPWRTAGGAGGIDAAGQRRGGPLIAAGCRRIDIPSCRGGVELELRRVAVVARW